MKLKEYRVSLGITAKEASLAIGVPLRTYIRYELDDSYGSELKRKQMYISLKEIYEITEDKGILSLNQIKDIVNNVLSKYGDEISFCYLFGSYAKGYAKDDSDVDLCISTTITGLKFFGVIEELRVELHKKVDLIRLSDLTSNIDLINEIMCDGIRVYKKD